MSIRPYRVSKIRSAALWSVSLGATALLWAFSPYVATAAGDDPTSVLNKMAAVYSNAKTFQASLTSKEVGTGKDGKQFSLTGTQEIRYKAPNMFNVVTKSVGAGALAGKKPDGSYMVDPGKVIINSDGKTITIYSETKNQYIRQPAGPTIPLVGVFSLLQHIPGPKTPGIYMDNATTVGGRPAYVVAVKRVMPPNLTADQKKQWEESAKGAQPLKIMVDKQTYQLLAINEIVAKGSVDVSFSSQAVNGTLPANAFTYAPPAGSKEAKQNPPPQPGAGGGGAGLNGLHP